jgi:hypothetical protein
MPPKKDHFRLGAIMIHNDTQEYVYPDIATKDKDVKYICPDDECKGKVVFCSGPIKGQYFRHDGKGSSCKQYTDRPSESQIHKDAKMLMGKLLLSKHIEFIRKCCTCGNDYTVFLPTVEPESVIKIEHGFVYNGLNKKADVAHILNSEIKGIFEYTTRLKQITEIDRNLGLK